MFILIWCSRAAGWRPGLGWRVLAQPRHGDPAPAAARQPGRHPQHLILPPQVLPLQVPGTRDTQGAPDTQLVAGRRCWPDTTRTDWASRGQAWAATTPTGSTPATRCCPSSCAPRATARTWWASGTWATAGPSCSPTTAGSTPSSGCGRTWRTTTPGSPPSPPGARGGTSNLNPRKVFIHNKSATS